MQQQKISPVRIFLLLSVIVSISAALGFLLAAGKIGKINLPVIINPVEKEVIITTDKTEYEQGDSVEITVTNNLKQSIISIAASSTPEFSIKNIEKQKPDGTWEELPIYCSWPECDIDFDGPAEIKSSEFVKFNWKPMVYANGKNVAVGQGLYRLNLEYQIKDKEWKTVYSNEFTIKEEKSEDVSIATDKAIYEQGEIIKIVVNNGLDKSILYSGRGDRFWGIEYFKEDKWINPAYEEGGGFQLTEENTGDVCNIALYERAYPTELLSQSNLKYQWNQKICPFGTEGPDKPKIVKYMENGKYRLVFHYGFEIDSNDEFKISEPKTVYSNEFTVKEKTVQNQDVSVVLNKTEYQKGETINGLINFNKDVYINPDIKIYKFNNNWEFLGNWNYDGTQITCCGLQASCEKIIITNSPIKFTWDQKVAKEDLPILPGNPITKIQVESGKYKITVTYGNQSVCVDGIDAEFIIK